MTREEIIKQGMHLVALYSWLKDDINEIKDNTSYDIDSHNVCTAFIKNANNSNGKLKDLLLFSYSNPSKMPNKRKIINEFELITDLPIESRFINIENIPGSHTEVKLINYIYKNDCLNEKSELAFFSLRKECTSCRNIISKTFNEYKKIYPKIKSFLMFAISESDLSILNKIDNEGNITDKYDLDKGLYLGKDVS